MIKNGDLIERHSFSDETVLSIGNPTDDEIEEYLRTKVNIKGTYKPIVLTLCGGINLEKTPFVTLKSGYISTAQGLTMEYVMPYLKKYHVI